ncbi:ty3-gypsy retroelement transposase [Cucumis melo var. makuwa]|uniref:Ty3-gypsy retroelement transposase n=1 Tax=Cucumis melo var. makuwa TaxID=1194695 RepID=A0A5D3CGU6_CUCMM|nr:ty3-gypsy retroelement transposase [Cucumis melo var. makuwa]
MMQLALKAEIREIIQREANLYGYSRGKYLYNSVNYNKSNAGSNFNDERNNSTTPIRTITLRSTANGEVNKEGPSKRLSDAEFKAKREKGLCFKCDEKYHSRRKCKDMELRELRMFMVHEDNVEEEIIEEDYHEPKELNMFEVEGGVNVVVESSINSVVGLTNLGTLVNEMKLHTKETSHYGVILGSGAVIKGKSVCENVEIMLNDWKWLYSMGVTETDRRNLTMTFVHEDSDQGYLVECRTLEGGIILSEEVVEEEANMIPADVQKMLDKFNDVFEWLETLPPRRAIEHQIHLKSGIDPVNVRPYRYAFHQEA